MRQSVEVVQGSHSDFDVVNKAFTGADAVFWLVPPAPDAKSVEAAYVGFTRPACTAFRVQGVKPVVGIRRWPWHARRQGRGARYTSLAMDDLIASTGVSYRALTNPLFMDNLLRQVAPIKTQGVFFSPIAGDRKLPACATRDIAAAATKLLLDHSWSGHGSVAVLGPRTYLQRHGADHVGCAG